MQKLLNFGLVYHITLSQGLNMGPPGFQTSQHNVLQIFFLVTVLRAALISLTTEEILQVAPH